MVALPHFICRKVITKINHAILPMILLVYTGVVSSARPARETSLRFLGEPWDRVQSKMAVLVLDNGASTAKVEFNTADSPR